MPKRLLIGQKAHDAEHPDLYGEIVRIDPSRIVIRTGEGTRRIVPREQLRLGSPRLGPPPITDEQIRAAAIQAGISVDRLHEVASRLGLPVAKLV